MPRKSKDELNEFKTNNNLNTKKSSNNSVSANNSTDKSSILEKKNNSLAKSSTSKKKSSTTVNSNILEKDSDIIKDTKTAKSRKVSKNTDSNKTLEKKSTNKKTSTVTTNSKSTSKKTNRKKVSSKSNSSSNKIKNSTPIVEYYDLPFRYNETVVKILAQTPTTLFIYWDISDSDKNIFVEKYGEDFFGKTKPVLLVTNKTMNYHFEVEINDFANSWYLHVNDANCDYSVELGRRLIEFNSNTTNIDNYVYIATSNDIEMPNNHILFDKLGKTVFFKNVKNNFVEEKEISSISFIKNIGKIYDIYDLYMEMYKNEFNIQDLTSENIKLNLSSSNSSTFK